MGALASHQPYFTSKVSEAARVWCAPEDGRDKDYAKAEPAFNGGVGALRSPDKIIEPQWLGKHRRKGDQLSFKGPRFKLANQRYCTRDLAAWS